MGWLSKDGRTEEQQHADTVKAGTENRRGSSNGGSTQSVIDAHRTSRQPENRAARGNGK